MLCRRFPYAQLLFCLACLTMAAYLFVSSLMCVELTPDEIGPPVYGGDALGPSHPLEGQYVRLSGVVGESQHYPRHPGRYVIVRDATIAVFTVLVHVDAGRQVSEGAAGRFAGRVTLIDFCGCGADHEVVVDTSAYRFTGATMAGLLVGTMGVLVLGLYLRRWLIERKALASQPQQDMIA
jgi:hypothetical protein